MPPFLLNPFVLGIAAAAASLDFLALYPDDTTREMLGVHTGTGDITTVHTSANYRQTFGGTYQLAQIDEPMWEGGRVVENQALHSNDFTNGAWIPQNSFSLVGIAAGVGPDGEDAMEVAFTSDANARLRQVVGSSGPTRTVSVYVKPVDGLATSMRLSSANQRSPDIALDGTWQRVSYNSGGTSSNRDEISNNAAGTTTNLYLLYAQVEYPIAVTQTPSEYVDTTTVISSKTFANANGNTVSANVVTEAVGADLVGMPWLLRHQDATNSQKHSADQTDVEWTATAMTVAQDAVGLAGAPNTACTLTATAANGTVIANAITAASATQSTKWFIKRKTGTGTIELTVDNGSTWQAVTVTADFTPLAVDQATVTDPQIGIRVVTDTDAVYIGNAECHLAVAKEPIESAALGPIFTTTAAVSVDGGSATLPRANFNLTSAALYFEQYTEAQSSSTNNDYRQGIGFHNGDRDFLFVIESATKIADKAGGSKSLTVASPQSTNKLALIYDATPKQTLNGNDTWAAEYSGALSVNDEGGDLYLGNVVMAPHELGNLRNYSGTYDQYTAQIDELMINYLTGDSFSDRLTDGVGGDLTV